MLFRKVAMNRQHVNDNRNLVAEKFYIVRPVQNPEFFLPAVLFAPISSFVCYSTNLYTPECLRFTGGKISNVVWTQGVIIDPEIINLAVKVWIAVLRLSYIILISCPQ